MSSRIETILGHVFYSHTAKTRGSDLLSQAVFSRTGHVFKVHEEVAEALASNQPVVALESTIVSHGMPWPENFATAKEVEGVVRKHGAVPATIAIVEGCVHIGLSEEKLKVLAQMGEKAHKISRRDIAAVIALRGTGGTTVSATSLLACKAGISVFATGGIGGVHRDGQNSMDVSADLTELGRTPICVVCAGVKSLLDIGRTLEVLETHGVTVVAYKSTKFPAFFVPDSGYPAPRTVYSAKECASLIKANIDLNLQSGMLVAVPIPADQAANNREIEDAIQEAIRQAHAQNIRGKDITPFLLRTVNELTRGSSLTSNIALIKNNASVAAEIAVALTKQNGCIPPVNSACSSSPVVVVGGCALDIVSCPKPGLHLWEDSSTPGFVCQGIGGVSWNICSSLVELGVQPLLVTAVGGDSTGSYIRHEARRMGLSQASMLTLGPKSAVYNAILDSSGSLMYAIADMDILESITIGDLIPTFSKIISAKIVVLDGNFTTEVISEVVELCFLHNVPVWYEPTSVEKCTRIVPMLKKVSYISPNFGEYCQLVEALSGKKISSVDEAKCSVDVLLNAGVRNVILTLGKHGVFVATSDHCRLSIPAPALNVTINNVTGAGDALVAGCISGILHQESFVASVKKGVDCAAQHLLRMNQ